MYWVFILSIILIVHINIVDLTTRNYLFLLEVLISTLSGHSAIIILWNWIRERESNLYSADKVGIRPLVLSFIKLYIYRQTKKISIPAHYVKVLLNLKFIIIK